MPFLIPLVAGAAGLSAVGTAVLQVGLAVGLSYASQKLRPKVKSGSSAPAGVRIGLKIDPNPPRQLVIGEVATPGSLVYWQLSGTDNKTLHMVFALADHECTSLQSVIVNAKDKSWNSTTGEVADYGSSLVVRFYSGASGQTADSELIASSGGRWTSNEKGEGVCYVVAKMIYDEAKFPSGIPELGFVIRGAKLLDPRTGTTSWSDNPTVAIYNILRGITAGGQKFIGMNVPASSIRASETTAAANACDESVAKKSGGTEKRYRCNVVLDCSQTSRDLIETVLASMAGEVIEAGGIYRIMAGVAQTPIAYLTDDDIIVKSPMTTRPKRGRNEIVNAVQGSFTDPTLGWASIPLPPRTSSADEALDGGIRLTRSLDLVAVTSRSQAQRVMEIERRRARRMASASMTVRALRIGLEPGDCVSITSARRGYVSKTFLLQSKSGSRDLTSDIVLVETDAAIDDWTAAIDEIDDSQVINLASAGPSFATVTGVALTNVTITGAGLEQHPGIKVDWTPVTDPTVYALQLEFRKVGDTVSLDRQIASPLSGTYTWLDGIQGGVTYEARLKPLTRPERATVWSSWVAAPAASEPQIVAVAAMATDIEDGAVTIPKLSGQTLLEVQLAGALASVQGSVNERLQRVIDEINSLGMSSIQHRRVSSETRARVLVTERTVQTQSESLAQYQIEVTAALDAIDGTVAGQALTISSLESRVTETEGDITSQASSISALDAQINSPSTGLATRASASALDLLDVRVTEAQGDVSAVASDLVSLTTEVDGHTTTIDTLTTSVDGIRAEWAVVVNVDGKVVGAVKLDGSDETSSLDVLAATFTVSDPGVGGGAAVPLLSVETIEGTPRLVIGGDIYAKKVTADAIRTLYIEDPTGTYYYDFANGRQGTTDGLMTIDVSQGEISFSTPMPLDFRYAVNSAYQVPVLF